MNQPRKISATQQKPTYLEPNATKEARQYLNPPKKDQTETVTTFKKKKFRKYIFRNYKKSDDLGIIIFLAKSTGQETLENLIFEIFKISYPGIRLPNYMYLDSEHNVIQFNKIKSNAIIYFYISEADVDMQLCKALDSNNPYESENEERYWAIEEQAKNLDLFVIKEHEFNDYLSGRLDLFYLEQNYAELQFFLEECYEETWNYLYDFAQVSYARRKRLAKVVDLLEAKRKEINQVQRLVEETHQSFAEQEALVKEMFSQLGFEEDFIEKPILSQRNPINTEPVLVSGIRNSSDTQGETLSHKQSILSNDTSHNASIKMKKTNSIKSILHSNKFSSNDLSIKPAVVFGIDENDFLPKNAKDV